jgi:hypothetical protein
MNNMPYQLGFTDEGLIALTVFTSGGESVSIDMTADGAMMLARAVAAFAAISGGITEDGEGVKSFRLSDVCEEGFDVQSI